MTITTEWVLRTNQSWGRLEGAQCNDEELGGSI
jgi:hypothetical protein